MIRIRPDYKQLLADTFWWVLLFCLSVGCAPFLVVKFGLIVNLLDIAFSLMFLLFIAVRYIILRNIRWEIDNETICRQRGVFVREKDYLELYRVVDYAEQQTLLQRIFGVKTVVILSTDRSDAQMPILGVPVWFDLVGKIRNRVEQCKTAKRIYEITNN